MTSRFMRLALPAALLASCILFVARPALGQDTEDAAADEAVDQANDIAPADDQTDSQASADDPQDDPNDGTADDGAADDNVASTDDGSDAATDVDEFSVSTDDSAEADDGTQDFVELPLEEWTPVSMTEDEVWAAELDENPADDSIPIDTELDPSGSDWQVVDDDIVGDYSEDVNTVEQDGIRTAGEMPVVRRSKPGTARPATSQPEPGRTASARPGDDDDVTYSTGGKPIREYGAPWQAQIYYPKTAPQWAAKLKAGTPLWQLQHYCGGTLIANDWVLTAAHCIDADMMRAGYRVRLGANNIQDPNEGWSYKIDRIVRHEQYADESLPKSPNRYANDIALIRIVADRPLPPRDPTRVRAIPLFTEAVGGGVQVAATGWGKTEAVDGAAPSAVLMRVDLRVMDNERCKQLPGYGPQKISGSVICAANPKKSTCQGDSGGGLTLASGDPRVVGVVSWGKRRCSGDGQPGAYTRVASYSDWIRRAMALNPQQSSLR